MGEGSIFSLCQSTPTGRRYPHPLTGLGGIPIRSWQGTPSFPMGCTTSFLTGVPHRSRCGGTPSFLVEDTQSLLTRGTPLEVGIPSRPGKGIPPSRPGKGVSPVKAWEGVNPHQDLGWGTPTPKPGKWVPLPRPDLGYLPRPGHVPGQGVPPTATA